MRGEKHHIELNTPRHSLPYILRIAITQINHDGNGLSPSNSLTIKTNYKNDDQTFCAFIDFKKAFDLVDRDFMLYKLRKIGLSGKLYHAIKALYKTSKSSVQIK